MYPKEELDKVIGERDESKRKVRELENSTDDAELVKARNEIAELKELTGKIPGLEAAAAEAEALGGIVKGRLDKVLEELPEAVRGKIPESLPLTDRLGLAESLKGTLTTPNSPGLELSGGGGNGTTISKEALADLPVGPRHDKVMQQIRDGDLQVVD
jgi:hypothetical protein